MCVCCHAAALVCGVLLSVGGGEGAGVKADFAVADCHILDVGGGAIEGLKDVEDNVEGCNGCGSCGCRALVVAVGGAGGGKPGEGRSGCAKLDGKGCIVGGPQTEAAEDAG